jgi:hypothetical protein
MVRKYFWTLLLAMPSVAFAAEPLITNMLNWTYDGHQVSTIPELILASVDILMTIAIPVAVAFIIWAGFDMVVAQGDPGKVSKGRQKLLNAMVGLAIVLAAKGIQLAIQGTVRALQ